MREPGFYWIKINILEEWTIAEYDGRQWWFIGGVEPLFTKHEEDIFYKIGEMIKKP